MRWASYRVRLEGTEYLASAEPRPDGLWMRVRRSTPADGFEQVVDGLYVQPVRAEDCTAVVFVTTTGQWRGAMVQVHDERQVDESGEQLLIEYVGGSAPEARSLGLERFEPGVYRGWVDRIEVRGIRENTTLLID